MLSGVRTLSRLVGATLGPAGRNVIVELPDGRVMSTNDGATVARSVHLADPVADMGARLLRTASTTADHAAGDGTTTATLLAEALIGAGERRIEAGSDPLTVARRLREAAERAVALVGVQAQPVETTAAVAEIATAASGDANVGRIVALALDRAGKEGIVTVEEGALGVGVSTLAAESAGLECETAAGMALDMRLADERFEHLPARGSGFAAASLAGELSLDEPLIAVVDAEIASGEQLIPAAAIAHQSGRALVIVAHGFSEDARAMLWANARDAGLQPVPLVAPSLGLRRSDLLEDLATAVGGRVLGSGVLGGHDRPLRGCRTDDLGSARRVVVPRAATTGVHAGDRAGVSRAKATFTGGAGAPHRILARVRQLRGDLRHQRLTHGDPYDVEQLQVRLARLAGRTVVLRVHAPTQWERTERVLRIEDALHSARSAIRRGAVVGGGVALAAVSRALRDGDPFAEDFADALLVPLRRIAVNAGRDGDSIVRRQLEELAAIDASMAGRLPGAIGYDARRNQWCDLWQAGVIDSAETVRQAIISAASAATTLLTSEAVVPMQAQNVRFTETATGHAHH
nr:TCP-1/cpn60 chaperonin family protein [Pseudoclavibacter sp. 13-3]